MLPAESLLDTPRMPSAMLLSDMLTNSVLRPKLEKNLPSMVFKIPPPNFPSVFKPKPRNSPSMVFKLCHQTFMCSPIVLARYSRLSTTRLQVPLTQVSHHPSPLRSISMTYHPSPHQVHRHDLSSFTVSWSVNMIYPRHSLCRLLHLSLPVTCKTSAKNMSHATTFVNRSSLRNSHG